jgi:chemotaxis protein CheD
MERCGGVRSRMTAKIAGGAKMFEWTGKPIGDRKVEAVKKELQRLNIRVIAEDTGGNYGRTIQFDSKDGSLLIKTVGKGARII